MAEVWGRVVALQAGFCSVVPEADPAGEPSPPADPRPEGWEASALPGGRLLCTRRSRLDHAGLQVCVGDRVRLEAIDPLAGRAAVAAVAPRANLLQRPPVANVSCVVVVASLAEPSLDAAQLSRFLLSAEACGAAVELVLSKADLAAGALRHDWQERLRGWGYAPHAVSSRSGEGLQSLAAALSRPGGIAVLCGPSGAGKSSLLNALCPSLALRVAPVSGRLRRGRHTTRHVELFALAGGALLADTPGFNRPELPAEAEALAWLYPDLRARLAAGPCRFRNCRHLGDPGCVAGTDWPRFPDYRQCREELERGGAVDPGRSRASGPISRRAREG